MRSYEQNKRNNELPHRKPHQFGGVLRSERGVSWIVPADDNSYFLEMKLRLTPPLEPLATVSIGGAPGGCLDLLPMRTSP